MSRDEFIGKLNALYVGDKNCLEELITVYDEKDKEIERLKEDYAKEKYLVDKYTRQLTDEYKNTEYQCKEKERLNNIINELEKWLEERLERLDIVGYDDDIFNGIELALYKLQELKGSE